MGKNLARRPHRLLVGILTLAAWLALPPGSAASADPEGQSQPSPDTQKAEPKPPYWKDPRLEREVSFKDRPASRETLAAPDPDPQLREAGGAYRVVRLVQGRILSGEELVKAIQKETGVRVMLQADWLREHVALPEQGGPARELMDGLAAAFGGKWLQVKGTWILNRSLEEARLTLLTEDERGQAIRQSTGALLRSFTAEQWRGMAQKHGIGFNELTPAQRALILTELRLYYYEPFPNFGYAPGPQALSGQGVRLRLTGSGRDAQVGLIAPVAPGRDPMGPFEVGIPFYAPSGELQYAVPPPQ